MVFGTGVYRSGRPNQHVRNRDITNTLVCFVLLFEEGSSALRRHAHNVYPHNVLLIISRHAVALMYGLGGQGGPEDIDVEHDPMVVGLVSDLAEHSHPIADDSASAPGTGHSFQADPMRLRDNIPIEHGPEHGVPVEHGAYYDDLSECSWLIISLDVLCCSAV